LPLLLGGYGHYNGREGRTPDFASLIRDALAWGQT
jgi:hypothetical protein